MYDLVVRRPFTPHWKIHPAFIEGCDGCKSFRDWKNARNASWTKPAARMQEVSREALIEERRNADRGLHQ